MKHYNNPTTGGAHVAHWSDDEQDVWTHILDDWRAGTLMDPLRVDVSPRGGQLHFEISAWRGDELEIEHNGVLVSVERQETTQGQEYPFYVQRAQIVACYGDTVKLIAAPYSCLIHCCRPYPEVEIADMPLKPELYWHGILLADILRECE